MESVFYNAELRNITLNISNLRLTSFILKASLKLNYKETDSKEY